MLHAYVHRIARIACISRKLHTKDIAYRAVRVHDTTPKSPYTTLPHLAHWLYSAQKYACPGPFSPSNHKGITEQIKASQNSHPKL